SGISPPFGRLSQARGQVTYVLLTRAPLYSGSCPPFLARLACIRHAASVRSEPGSNSPVEIWSATPHTGTWRVTSKDRRIRPGQHDDSRCPFDHAWDLFRAELLGKGALLFSFQRPGSSTGRPRLIREGLPIVKAACPRSRPPRSGRRGLDQADLGEAAASHRQEPVPVALESKIEAHRLAVDPHGALRDQAPGLRGGGREPHLLQELA